MKNIIVSVGLMLISLNTQAWFRVDADVYVTSHRIHAVVSNYGNSNMQCVGRIFGRTQLGQVGHQDFSFSSVGVGSKMSAFLATWGHAYFVAGHAQVQCRFIGR